ncbi:MAG: MFS transporter, partial [Alphaproteobacteria bacterium]|nr:MFS transporter [Alphaproteobacteria bacterium]
IGLIGGSYTFAAALAGFTAAFFLDRYARKRAILLFLAGLILATLGGAIAWSRESMIAMRLLAGMFGGPLTSLAVSLVADYIPPERRGAAMGKVMGAFAAASVLGVPFGLELSERISWHAPFIFTAIMGAAVWVMAWKWLPYHAPLAAPKPPREQWAQMRQLFSSKLVWASYAMMTISMTAAFMVIPNISAHLQLNLDYPREHIGLLYLCGGTVSFFGMRLAGKIMDKTSATAVCLAATAVLTPVLLTGFVFYGLPVPIVIIFMGFMLAMSARNVCAQTLSSKIPAPQLRAAFMSVQSAMTHLGGAAGSYASSLILVEQGRKLLHMPTVGTISLSMSLIVPFLFYYIERRLTRPS